MTTIQSLDHIVNDGYNLLIEANGEKTLSTAAYEALLRNNARIAPETLELVAVNIENELA